MCSSLTNDQGRRRGDGQGETEKKNETTGRRKRGRARPGVLTWRNFKRVKKSRMYEPNGFNDGYDFFFHVAGIFDFNIDINTSSNSADMTTRPLIAFCTSISD